MKCGLRKLTIIIKITMRQSRIEKELDEVRQLPWALVVQCSPKGIERDDLWILWVPGRPNSLWEGGIYPVRIEFPPQYPVVSPIVTFEPDFKHPHIYPGGAICLPLLQSQYWRSKVGMCDILQRIISLIHQDVNPYSPANVDIFRLSKEDPVKYQEILREQANRYSKRSEKYYQEPSMHIDIVL